MNSKHRWLIATITNAQKSDLQLPWTLTKNRRDWSRRCAERAKFKAYDGPMGSIDFALASIPANLTKI